MLKLYLFIGAYFISGIAFAQTVYVNDLAGTWIMKQDSFKYTMQFIDNSHVSLDSLKKRIMIYEVVPKNNYSLFILKYPDSTKKKEFFYIEKKSMLLKFHSN